MLLGHSNVREQKDTPEEGPWSHAAPTFPDSQTQYGTSEETVFSLSAYPWHTFSLFCNRRDNNPNVLWIET